MNMKNLQYVLAVCQEGNITAAAHTQHVSQPALSQAIKQEEQNLGTSIFQRGSTPLQLTPAGKRYVETGRQIMMLEQNLKNELSDLKGESTGILRFGISAQEGMYLLPRVLPRFFQMYPQVKLCVEERGSALLEEMLLDGTVAIGCWPGMSVSGSPWSTACSPKTSWCCCAPRTPRWHESTPAAPASLSGMPRARPSSCWKRNITLASSSGSSLCNMA